MKIGSDEQITQVKNAKLSCCGCGACTSVCSRQAITMTEDEDGFVYPVTDYEKCNNCGACIRVCAYRSEGKQHNKPQQTYVAVTQNTDITKSASGGVFASLATSILGEGGIVYGSAMETVNGRLKPVHIGVEDANELYRLMGSKYVQSDMGTIYKDIKTQILTGRKVLFSGTPCQVDAVKAYLGHRSYDNLLLVDIICHGVPSAKMFGDYINRLEQTYKGKVTQFLFRDKEYGWGTIGSYVVERDGKRKKYILPFRESSYYSLFMASDIFRENCYCCKYACSNRVGDITIGDYWGIQIEHPELLLETGGEIDRRKGVSCLIVNTANGEAFLQRYQSGLQLYPSEFAKVATGNEQLCMPNPESTRRKDILEIYRTEGYGGIEQQFIKQNRWRLYAMKAKRKMPPKLKKVVKKLLHRS